MSNLKKILMLPVIYLGSPVLKRFIAPLKAKRRPLYLKTQFVPRNKHFSSRL